MKDNGFAGASVIGLEEKHRGERAPSLGKMGTSHGSGFLVDQAHYQTNDELQSLAQKLAKLDLYQRESTGGKRTTGSEGAYGAG